MRQNPTNPPCPHCGATHTQKSGPYRRRSTAELFQMFRCCRCWRGFSNKPSAIGFHRYKSRANPFCLCGEQMRSKGKNRVQCVRCHWEPFRTTLERKKQRLLLPPASKAYWHAVHNGGTAKMRRLLALKRRDLLPMFDSILCGNLKPLPERLETVRSLQPSSLGRVIQTGVS